MEDQQPNNRPARIQGQWRHLIHLSIFILGAAALYLRLGGDDDGHWNFILGNNNLEEGHQRHLLRDMSRRTALVNCNKFNGRRIKCKKSGCAWSKSDNTCKATATTTITTTTTTTPAAGSTTCLEWHPLPGQQPGHPVCTNYGNVPSLWTDCQHTNGVLFFNSGEECCGKYFNNAPNCELRTEQELDQNSDGANTACHSWHPSIFDEKTCTNDDEVPLGWKNDCPLYNGVVFFDSGEECCQQYYKSSPTCKKVDINNMNQNSGGNTVADDSCYSWHPSIFDEKTCTNDENLIQGWLDGCPNYNGQLFFQSGEECCEKYFSSDPNCEKIDINNMNQNSAGLTTTTTTTTQATTTSTTTTTTIAATTPATPPPSRKPTPGPTPQPTMKPIPGPPPEPSKQPTPLPTKKPSPGPTPLPSKQPTPLPTKKPSPGPTHLPSKQPTPLPTKKPSPGPTPLPPKQPTLQPTIPGPTREPTEEPTKFPTKPPTNTPTRAPQHVKWYPRVSGSGKECVEGSDYPSTYPISGWLYESETDCCKAWEINYCGEKDVKWYPATSNGKNVCVEGTGYSWNFAGNGWLFNTEEACCDGMGLDCTPLPEKWYPTIVDGEKACIFGQIESYTTISFDSKGECCAAFPLACPTTTTTTTTTRPAVVTPPCQPSGGKGCHWWPDLVDWKIQCVYSSDWPPEASDLLFSDHDACYCTFNGC